MSSTSTLRFLPPFGVLALFLFVACGLARAEGDEDEKEKEWDVASSDMGPSYDLSYTVDEGTWISVDVAPDGDWVVFDVLGDIYRMPISGGRAERLRGGRPYEVQPRYSPDGDWISFTSDAGGGDNIWVMRADGSDARQVTQEDFRLLNNAVWTPDSKFLVARKHFTSRRSLGAGEMWMYDVAGGGGGVQLTKRPNDQKDVGEPEISPDGRYLYYTIDATPGSRFQYNKDPNTTIYSMRRVDLRSGDEITLLRDPGGSVRPQISPDGKTLAFVRRVRLKTVLMLLDLETGDQRMLFDGLSPDSQETWSVFGVYPGFDWTPDGRALVIWAQGKIMRVDAQTGEAKVIPMQVDIQHDMVEAVRFTPEIGGDTFPVRVLRWPRISPDGKTVVFQALGHLWTRDVAGGEPRRLTRATEFEFHPAWSPDGKWIVYTTWDDQSGGRVKAVRANGRGARTLDNRPGHYAQPRVSPDGNWVVYRRGGGDTYRGRRFTGQPGIYLVRLDKGKPAQVLDHGEAPAFDQSGDRIVYLERGSESKTLVSVDRLGGNRRELVRSERAMELSLSPDGRFIAFEELWEVYVAPRPAVGGVLEIGPNMKNLPVRKVSTVAGEFLDWSPDGRELRFGLGPDLFRVDVAPLFVHADETPQADPDSLHLGFDHPADVPDTDVVFVNATVLTMNGEEVVENGMVHVRGNRIVGVGRNLDVGSAERIDLEGRVLMPGLVDIHAHTGSSNMDLHAQTNWAFLANLAFGVTTTHDPSNNTRMIFGSSELVRAGQTLGPRVYSTGTILYGAEGDFKALTNSLEDARRHLKRLKAYGAFTAKSYNQPRRNQRQWYIKAGRELDVMILPEGGSMYGHNMSMVIDGHTTMEHALPLAPLYDDALELMARGQTAYTPTLVVAYGGLWGENYWYQHTDVWANERLLRFVPRSVVDPRSRRRVMAPAEDFHHMKVAAGAAEIERRGGTVQVGAHGQMQGLAVHWEMGSFGHGGLSPMEVLRVGTVNGARALGLDAHLGTVEAGKLADLIVLDADPRADLKNTESVALVMINGRLFEAETLAQVAPERKEPPQGPPLNSIPAAAWGGLEGCLAH